MKNLFLKIPGVESAHTAWQRRPGNSLEELLERFASTREGEVYFIQVGANDGEGKDPFVKVLRQFNWKGICVEPQAKAFAALKMNHAGNKNIAVENAAIAEETGVQTMFRISFSDDFWASAISSLRRDMVQKHIDCGYMETKAAKSGVTLPEDKRSWICEVTVSTITFADLLSRHDLPRVDALLLDVEGYEWKVLSQFDFDRYRPAFVALERMHLSPTEQNKIVTLLKNKGYRVRKTQQNFVAVL